MRSAVVGAVGLIALTSCGSDQEAQTYEGTEDLRSTIEDEGYPCEAFDAADFGDSGETLMCREGFSVTVWEEEDVPNEETGSDSEEGLQHLRGPNWNIFSADEEMLDDLHSRIGGERTTESLPGVITPQDS